MSGLEPMEVGVTDAPGASGGRVASLMSTSQMLQLPLEAAEAYKRLQDEFRLTQEDLAKRVGKERSTVTNFSLGTMNDFTGTIAFLRSD